jgi:uncharacterized membrane protein
MATRTQRPVVCQIDGKPKPRSQLVPAELIRDAVVGLIRVDHPDFDSGGSICLEHLGQYRARYVESLLADEKGELSSLDEQVVESMRTHELVATDIDAQVDEKLPLGDRVADKIADFGGSWTFIISFGAFLAAWMLINTVLLLSKPFDPYPFILLNLALSALAAIQAPVIMMSQNRQEDRDRARGENDYRVNLKAELEIRHLHEKMDHLLSRQWERLIEIQQIQIELLNEMGESRHGK